MDKDPKQETEVRTEMNVTRQTSNLRLRWEWTEASIWTESMLTALENGVKGGKWFSLNDKVYRPETLRKAWEKVRQNGGAAGIDKVTVERFVAHEQKYLMELNEELKSGSYIPEYVKRVYIPKGDGKSRPLGIPCIKDRVAQQAVKLVIEPIFEKEFHKNSYGFRPGKGTKDALREVDRLLKEGYSNFVDADLKAYFDTISHPRLMEKLAKFISDGRILEIVEKWLKAGIMDGTETWISELGTPQGGVLSPLLANLYLHDLDLKIAQEGGEMIRYADDFVILTKNASEAEKLLKCVQEWVKENELQLHPDKTHIGDCTQEGQGFDFLGYRFENKTKWIRSKSILKFRDKIRGKTQRTCGKSIEKVIASLNPILRGWFEYFKHVTKWGLESFDGFVRRRLRSILRKYQKKAGTGRGTIDHKTWPNKFFAKLGLFDMEENRRLEQIARQPRSGNYRLESRMR